MLPEASGADGSWAARLPPGAYEVSYRLDGYVPYTSGATEIRTDGQVVTVSLSRLLEATASAGREVRIILNWGSRSDQVREVDAHVACPCGAPDRHVYYNHRSHGAGDHGGEPATDRVWDGAHGLEWTLPSPPPYHSFTHPPRVTEAEAHS